MVRFLSVGLDLYKVEEDQVWPTPPNPDTSYCLPLAMSWIIGGRVPHAVATC